MKLSLLAAARRDRREASIWYGRQSQSALESFLRELRGALRFVTEYPEGSPQLQGHLRAKTLARFPFSIIYRAQAGRIVVIAIADERREPGTYEPVSNGLKDAVEGT